MVISVTQCETCISCHFLIQAFSKLSTLHHIKCVGGKDIIHRVEVANPVTIKSEGATVAHMFHHMSTCFYSKKQKWK